MSRSRSYYSRYDDVDDEEYYDDHDQQDDDYQAPSPPKISAPVRTREDFMSAFQSYKGSEKSPSPKKRPNWMKKEGRVTLKVGNWQKELKLKNYPYSFIHDIYYDEEIQGDKSVFESQFQFIPEQCDTYNVLREWEARGPSIFLSENQEDRNSNQLPLVYYSEVGETLRVLGTGGSDWLIYVVLDDLMDPNERYRLSVARGEVIRRLGIEVPIEHQRTIGRAREELKRILSIDRDEESLKSELQYSYDFLNGIMHNAFLKQIGDGTSETFFETMMFEEYGVHNKLIASGTQSDAMLEGANWAYIHWEDFKYLYEDLRISSQVPKALAIMLDDLFFPSMSKDCINLSLVIDEFAVPVAYWLAMNERADNVEPREVGLEGLTDNGVYRDRVDESLEVIINHTVVFSLSFISKKKGEVKVHQLYMGAIVSFIRSHLGTLALVKMYRIMDSYHRRMGDVMTKSFLDHCRNILSPYLGLNVTREEVMRIAVNDNKGMLLAHLPEYTRMVEEAKKYGLIPK